MKFQEPVPKCDAEQSDKDEKDKQEPVLAEVKEEILVDTDVVPEPVVFDPITTSSQEEDAVEDNILGLIAALGSNVEALKELSDPSKEQQGLRSSTYADVANDSKE